MAREKVTVGNVEIVSLSDTTLRFQTTTFFPSIPAAAWEPYRDSLAEDGRLEVNVACYILRSQGRTLIVDTGIGPGPILRRNGQLMEEMAAIGLRPDDIDITTFTHLHTDHVGWNLTEREGRPQATFPRARYVIQQTDWDYFTSPPVLERSAYIAQSVLPLRDLGVLDLRSGEYKLTDELTAILTPGHTPGHVSIMIASAGERAVVLGDIAHHPAQAHETDWTPAADFDPELSRRTRHQLFDRLEADGALIAAVHLPAPGFGRLVRLEGRRYWQTL